MAASAEMLCSMAALVLKDAGKEITGEAISAVLKSINAEVESYWPKLFAQALEGLDIDSLMTAVGSAAPAAAGAVAGGATTAAAEPAAAEKKEEEKEEEEDDDMGFSLFD
ncbi:60S acidic ribosomal protein P1 [Gregarina niphandrodes]|uniref:60S acidic ribosomal protein P1 n=1 Tax=Gregarina niphandrodes TaxID=110365 RepID=A0A023B145_GRENI|nr:60S acidic ribosomal protein P1 [Gregarina niphandrodes]EZG46520.1 60S acidic ribosomal protein P1 [Gregarina niphandrodes]|eukprot:XP_011132293.1 60S acidic ribosomal protein P1 [Gregarina niphandrodes]